MSVKTILKKLFCRHKNTYDWEIDYMTIEGCFETRCIDCGKVVCVK